MPEVGELILESNDYFFAFRVRNVEGLSRRLKEAGVVFDRELGPGPYGRAIYVRDPDGNILELFEQAASGA